MSWAGDDRRHEGLVATDAASVGFLHIRPDILRTARYLATAFALSAVFIHRNIFLATIR